MSNTTPLDRAAIIVVVQSILEEARSLTLPARDLALLMLMRHTIDSSAELTLTITYSEIRSLHSRLDTLDVREPNGAERRLSESLKRLQDAECVSLADMMRLGSQTESEYQITPLGDNITEWFLHQSVFSGEPLSAIFRSFISQLVRIAEDAEKAKEQEEWHYDVVMQMQYALKSMLTSISRHQKELDRQHAALREFIPKLLNERSEAAINHCEEQLTQVIKTIDDLQEVFLGSTSRAISMIEHIAELAKPYRPKGVDEVCEELLRRLNNIAHWTTQRAIDWVMHHNVVHHFLRTIVRVDRQRRVTEALRHAAAEAPNWTIEVVAEPRFMRMRDDLYKPTPKAPPKLPKETLSEARQFDEVEPDKLPEILLKYLNEELENGEAKASRVMQRAYEETGAQAALVEHFPWLIKQMTDVAKLDADTREWVNATEYVDLQEVRVKR